MKISLVRFDPSQAVLVGKSLDPKSYLSEGERSLDGQIHLSRYDETFLRVDFKPQNGQGYSQLIPWGQVSTVMFTEDAE